MRQKLITIFVKSSGFLFIITAIAKLISSLGTATILNHLDPIFLIPFGHFFQAAAVAECSVAVVCFLKINRIFQTASIAFSASNFLLYRLGYYWMGYHGVCPCMGNFTEAIHVPPQLADIIMKIILAYLLIGSYVALFWLWRQYERRMPLQT